MMRVELTFDEVEKVVESLRVCANEASQTARSGEYPSSVALEETARANALYTLAERLDDHSKRFRPKAKGSSGTVDPFDSPPQISKLANDPVEW